MTEPTGATPPAYARFRPLLTLALWYVAVCGALRLVLWWAFGRTAQVGLAKMLWIVPAGAIADAVQSLYLLGPFAVFLWLAPARPNWLPVTRRIVLFGAWIFCAVFAFVAAIEYYFFEEFDSRFNLVSVDYLMYPTEVAGDIWAEYPIVVILVVVAIAASLSVWLLRRRLHFATQPATFAARSGVFAAYALTLGVCIAFFGTNTLSFSRNRVAAELAANGPSSFFRALRTSEIDYHTFYATRDSAANLRNLSTALSRDGTAGRFTRLAEGRIDREFAPRQDGLGKLNVIVISSESFGAEFSKLYGSDRDWTPEFDKLARQSLWFRNMYASGTRTVRGLEAISSSFPPIPTDSTVRRPGNDAVLTWGEVLARQGYHSSFLYGGYGYFDNMNAFYQNNGYEVRDRNQMPKATRFANIWGVADEDLYDMALSYYDQLAKSGKPFFSQIMNTSNHKPFTFRTGLESVGVKADGGGRESGVRYADFAQGYFIREAAKHAWFDNTIFIIVADHGARVYGKQEIPLKTYEIPMLIYAPKHIAPRQIDGLMTQIDIAPTVMGLLGLGYTAPWFGQDVLHTPATGRVALFSHNHDVAIYRDGALVILGLQKSILNKRYDYASNAYSSMSSDAALNDLAIAYYQTAYELFRARKLE